MPNQHHLVLQQRRHHAEERVPLPAGEILSRTGERTRDILVYINLFSFFILLSYSKYPGNTQ